MIEPQDSIAVGGGYVLKADDIGLVVFINGTVIVPTTLVRGFYCTLINASDSIATISVTGGTLRSASGATALTARWQSCVLYKPNGGASDVIAIGMP